MPRVTKEVKVENRRRLLEAAAVEFAARGLEGANINEISVAAGLAKGTVYNYFPSKEALFLEVMREACELLAASSMTVPAEASTRERLRAVMAADIEWARGHEPFARVLVREVLTANPQFYPQVIEAAAPFISRVREILADGVQRGEVQAHAGIDGLALLFVGLGDLALISHWGSGGVSPALDDIPDLVVDLFVDGVAPRGAEEGEG